MDSDVSERLSATESALRQLDKDKDRFDQELKLLENDKDLVCLEITKLGGEPISEDQVDAAASRTTVESKKSEEENKEEEAKNNSEEKKEPPARRGKPRILVVDDNNELRQLLQRALEKDYEVLEASDGFQALSQILKQKQEYDLIITDLNMPNVDGITMVEHLPAEIPTIIISAFLKKPEFQEALGRIKPIGVFQKPFPIAKLREAIKKALD